MDNITNKVNGNQVDADEWNQLADIDNFISSAGLTPSTGDLNQIGKASARYSAGSDFYTDGGSANTYNLTPINNLKSPVGGSDGYFNGMKVRFRAGNNNTGASTVNISSFGSKAIKKNDGTTALTGGEITTTKDTQLRYDLANDCFILDTTLGSVATSTTLGLQYFNQPITISNNVSDANNDIDFSAGNFIFSDYSGQASLSALTKRLDATWAVGTNQGGLDTGAKANSTTYYCFAIYNPTTLVSDSLFSTSTTPTLPSGYTKYKKVGAIRTDGSGNIRAFYQTNNRFMFRNHILVNSSASTTSRVSLDMNVPSGAIAIFSASGLSASVNVTFTIFTNLDSNDISPSSTSGAHIQTNTNFTSVGQFQIQTNSAGAIGIRSNNTNASNIYVLTEGFILTDI